MKTEQIETAAENLGWSVNWYVQKQGKNVAFSKHTPAGQELYFDIWYDNLAQIPVKLYKEYENYDPSYEAYIWLDETGHGKNGAPHEMIDVYNDMKWSKDEILKLYNALPKI